MAQNIPASGLWWVSGLYTSLDIVPSGWCVASHERCRPPFSSLVAHLTKGGRCDSISPDRPRSPLQCGGLIVCPVWRSLGKFRKRST